MNLVAGAVVTGLTLGLLYGLLGFSIVLLHKATGVANFAQGNLSTLAAFVALQFVTSGRTLWQAVIITLVVMALVGVGIYVVLLRPNDKAGHLNVTIRTLGVYLLIAAIINMYWAEGQPFSFPSAFPSGAAFTLGGSTISWLVVGTLVTAVVLIALFGWFFRRTSYGLMFLAMAENPDVARLLGVRTRRLTVVAWVMSAAIATVVAVLIAPRSLVSTEMMDGFLLLAFSSAIIGGLSSLSGAFLGGSIVGVINSVVSVYIDAQTAFVIVFGVTLAALVLRPQGLLGVSQVERL